MAKNLSIGAILAIVIVTTLIVSIATVSITGNVIRVKSVSTGTQIYTKSDLNKCIVVDGDINGNAACLSYGKSCIFSIARMERISTQGEFIQKVVTCKEDVRSWSSIRDSDDFQTLCC